MTALSLREIEPRPTPDAGHEANHRIANNLMALAAIFSERLGEIEDGPEMVPSAALADLVKEMAGRLNALGRLHHLLSAVPRCGDVDLDEVLSEVFEGFRSTGMFGDRLHVHLSASGQRVNAARASMLMLVVAEIATNAAKYAHPTGIPVEFSVSATQMATGGLKLHIGDDGVGLPEGFDHEHDAGSGLRLMRGLVENAGGRLEMATGPLGLRFAIELPPTGISRAGPPPAEVATSAA